MLEIASQMILCLLLAALLGFIIGYLFGKMTCANDDCAQTKESTHDDTHSEDTHLSTYVAPVSLSEGNTSTDDNLQELVSKDKDPQVLTAPRNGEKDNLSRIKGIGMKLEESLNNIGIYHFDQIAAWTTENITWADETLGFPGRADRENWVEQAKLLAAGEETEFSKRVDAGKVESSKQD